MKSLPLTWSALVISALITLPASATTMTSLSSFEGEEEPTVIYYPATKTFKDDSSFINITNVSPGVVQMLLRYNSTWWDGDGAVSTRTDRQRAEVKGLGPHQKVGDLFEYITTWRTSPNFPSSSHWEDFFQLKATDGDDSLPLVFGDVREGPANAHVMWLPAGASSHVVARNIPSADATWQALTWRIKTSPRGSSTGLVQASVNGDSFQGPTNVDVSLASSTDYRPKWGLYRGLSTGLALGTDNGADYIQHSNVCVNKITSTTTAAPDFNPGGGIYSGAQNAIITSATPGAVIHYTTDGSTPSATHGTVYTGPVTVNATTTVQAIASASGMTDSSVNFVTYVINGTSVAAPTFSPAAGTYTSTQSVSITSATSGASIRYTTDGSTPSETAGTLYSGPVNVSSSITFTAIAYKAGLTDSNVVSAAYTINIALPPAAAPVFSPAAGTYTTAQNVTITSATGGASIRYTTDGSTPSETAGTLYSGPVHVSANLTLKAIAYAAGFTDSTVTSGAYTITPPPTLNFEAESMSPVGTGATVSISDDANASGGVLEFLNSTAVGQSITFTTPSIPAGTYQVQLRYKTNKTRGQHNLKIDGTQVGGTLDQYATTQAYLSHTFGNVTFATTGTHSIVMTVTGKNSAATAYYLTADKFTFVGQ